MENERLVKIFEDLEDLLQEWIRRHGITSQEYWAGVRFLERTAAADEIPLLTNVFLEHVVDEVGYRQRGEEGTPTCIEGPYYIEGAPELERPYVMPMRDDEPGDLLVFQGRVDSSGGGPIAGALIDLWQADAEGVYSNVDPRPPEFNLRGRFRSDEEGRFEVLTIVPAAYTIPHEGPTGELLTLLGRHPWRPAHLHVKLTADGHLPLTTQLYFEGDEYLESDAASAVKPGLVTELVRCDDEGAMRERGLEQPFFTLAYDFELPKE